MAIPLKKPAEGSQGSFMVRLIELQGELAKEHNLMPLFDKIVSGAIGLFGGGRALLALSEHGALQVKATHNIDPSQLDRPPFRRFWELSEEAFKGHNGRLSTLSSGEGIPSLQNQKCISVPLSDKGACIGALVVEGNFSMDDLQLFQLFANQAAIAVQNAKAFEELTSQGGSIPIVSTSDINPGETLDHIVAQFEAEVIKKVIERNHGNKTLAAKSLGITRGTLYNKLNAAKSS